MKTTVGNIAEGFPILRTLGDKKLPIQQAYKLSKMLKAVQSEFAIYDENHMAIATRFGHPNAENADLYDITDRAGYTNALNELLSTETEIACEPIDLTGLDIDISAIELMRLGNLVTFNESVDKCDNVEVVTAE